MSAKSTNKIIDNTYSALKRSRNVITTKVVNALQKYNACSPERISKELSGKNGMKKLGEGVYGIVHVAPIGENRYMAIKREKLNDNSIFHEYAMMKYLTHKGMLVPKPYAMRKCNYGNIMYYEYANGGTLEIFIDRLLKKPQLKAIVPYYFKSIICQILYTIYYFQQNIPGFRHNDLHLGNVLISKSGKKDGYSRYKIDGLRVLRKNLGIIAYIHDFGFANCKALPNEEVEKNYHKKSYGIATDSNVMYDVHFFLNCLYHKYKNEPLFAGAKQFIEDSFTPLYLKRDSPFVENYRLKYRKQYVPTFKRLFSHPYFDKGRPSPQNELIQTLLPSIPPKLLKSLEKKYKINKNKELKIDTRKCRLYKKEQLLKFTKSAKIPTVPKMTKEMLCKALRKKYINNI